MRNAIILTIMLLALAASGHAAIFSGPSLNASLLYYQPIPASPGTSLNVYIQLHNNGEEAKQVKVQFVDNQPFTLESEAERVQTIATVPGGGDFLVKYNVRVDQNAVPGTSYVKIQYSIGLGQTQTALLPIDIFSNAVALNIENIKLDPASFVPGGIGKLSFQLRNDAPIKIRDGTVTLELGSVDLTPVAGTNQQRFTDLQAGQTKQFVFELSPNPNMESGIYKIPVSINFSDQNGRSYSRQEYIGVRVGAKPDVAISVEESSLATNQYGEVTLRITNKGLGEVKFVNLKFGEAEGLTLSSTNERYIGNIDSDDYKTAQLILKASQDKVELPVTITYLDALNTEYTREEVLTLRVQEASSGGIPTYLIVGIVVIVLVVGYFLFRRRRA
jgi:hypothetical protein